MKTTENTGLREYKTMGNATFYQIKETLTLCSAEDIFSRKPGDPPYVVVMDPETWTRTKEKFDMVIDMDTELIGTDTDLQLRRTIELLS